MTTINTNVINDADDADDADYDYDYDYDVDIIKLIGLASNLSLEKNKEEFIKNYSTVKEQMQMVDKILNYDVDEVDEVDEVDNIDEVDEVDEVDNIDEVDEVDNIDEVDKNDEKILMKFKKMSINELFEILEKNQHKISNPTNLLASEKESLL